MTRTPVGYGNLATVAELVGLGPSEMQNDAPAFGFDVHQVQAHQLRAPEAPCEADKQQGAVPDILDAVAHGIEHDKEVYFQQRLRLALGYAFQAPDPLEGGFGHLRPRRV